MKTFKYMLIAVVALMAATACSDSNNNGGVSDPTMTFCAVNDPTTTVSQLTFTKWNSFQMVDIQSNIDWQVSCDADWVTLSNHSGVGMTNKTLHLKVTVEENTTEQNRTANLTLTGGGLTAKLTILQNSNYVDPLGWVSATDAGNAMKVGLNLYNSLEAFGDWFDWKDADGNDNIDAFQTCWGNPLVTADWFNAVKANGFNAVRIPVTWFPHMDENDQVSEKWMNRVEEVVNFALDAGLYVIINVHHDTGDGGWIAADLSNIDEISERYVTLWTQIATRFEQYGDHLMFESYNEILDKNNAWANVEGDAFIAVNQLAQTFVNTIRGLGGNNGHRNLIVNTYAAQCSSDVLGTFEIPTDQITDHLMVQIHNYDPADFCRMTKELKDDEELPLWTEDYQNELAAELDVLIDYYDTYHVPIIIGEFAANDKLAEEERAKYAEFMVTYCRQNANISLFYWNNIIDRTTFQPSYPLVMQALLKAKDY